VFLSFDLFKEYEHTIKLEGQGPKMKVQILQRSNQAEH
jgi:hypothetical protein